LKEGHGVLLPCAETRYYQGFSFSGNDAGWRVAQVDRRGTGRGVAALAETKTANCKVSRPIGDVFTASHKAVAGVFEGNTEDSRAPSGLAGSHH
jgi:hypothetical protein